MTTPELQSMEENMNGAEDETAVVFEETLIFAEYHLPYVEDDTAGDEAKENEADAE